MLRKILIGLALLLTPVCASAQTKVIPLVGNSPWSVSNPAPVTGTFTPSGTADVNITKILGERRDNHSW